MEARKVRVLVADDEPHIRGLIGLIVRSLGAEVVGEAADGQQALTLFEQARPDLVMLDINMPAIDGIEVLRRMHAARPSVPVIMLSSLDTADVVSRCLDQGARHYLLKNTTAEALRQSIARTWADYLREIRAAAAP